MTVKQAVVKAEEVTIGFHPLGFRIDKTAEPMNRYTRWTVDVFGRWSKPEPVCFHSLPEVGWQKIDHFKWPH